MCDNSQQTQSNITVSYNFPLNNIIASNKTVGNNCYFVFAGLYGKIEFVCLKSPKINTLKIR